MTCVLVALTTIVPSPSSPLYLRGFAASAEAAEPSSATHITGATSFLMGEG